MNNHVGEPITIDSAEQSCSRHVLVLKRELAIMAGRFAHLLRERFSEDSSAVSVSLHFLQFRYNEVFADIPLSHWKGDCCERIASEPDSPLHQLVTRLQLQRMQVEMLLVAGLTQEHEGFADIFRTLHPSGLPLPTVGLVAQLVCTDPDQRVQLRHWIEITHNNYFSLFRCDDEQPFFTRSLRLLEGVWSWLHQVDVWPKNSHVSFPVAVCAGLGRWFEQPQVQQVIVLLQKQSPFTLMLNTDNSESAVNRAVALCQQAQRAYCVINVDALLQGDVLRVLQVHCLLRTVVPILTLSASANNNTGREIPVLDFGRFPIPVIVCADHSVGTQMLVDNRPLRCLPVEALSAADLRTMWRQLLPQLTEQADQLAARYPFDPVRAQLIRCDLQQLNDDANHTTSLTAVTTAIRSRSASVVSGSIRLVHPRADWSQLVLPPAQLTQLQEAASRLLLQSTVLDDWQFLNGRRGARGVRMLFSGPPGTGKTLSAEVMASVLGVDLLEVDLSRVVSKWIGETEKNLSDIFMTAESTRAVLFFDEADALFGKRTEVSDAHDRYANLETAYLLSRLEQYDGLAVLATNYRQNIDAAFSRRLEFIIEFEEPGVQERLKLWQCHVPSQAPLSHDVDFSQLAALFPIVGGHIRNAAVAAAYLAAKDASDISQDHFINAIRREYEKSGKAYREVSRR